MNKRRRYSLKICGPARVSWYLKRWAVKEDCWIRSRDKPGFFWVSPVFFKKPAKTCDIISRAWIKQRTGKLPVRPVILYDIETGMWFFIIFKSLVRNATGFKCRILLILNEASINFLLNRVEFGWNWGKALWSYKLISSFRVSLFPVPNRSTPGSIPDSFS